MLTASLVLYHNSREKLIKTLNSFLSTPCKKKLFVIDNSENNELEDIFSGSTEVCYYFTGKNLGFGAGHNHILDEIDNDSNFHLILNPDIYFDSDVVIELMEYVEERSDIGLIAPLVVFPDGSIQYSFRKYPTPIDLIIRRLPLFKTLFGKRFKQTHYLNVELDKPFLVDSVMGCFQMFRTSVYKSIGGFDDQYFMYLEDIDICRKVAESGYGVLLYPQKSIVHYLEKGSAKNVKLFLIHFESAIKYFKKWGW